MTTFMLLIRANGGPRRFTRFPIAASTCVGSLPSHGTASQGAFPLASASRSISLAASADARNVKATGWPSAERCSTRPLPMPRVPPVTSTHFASRLEVVIEVTANLRCPWRGTRTGGGVRHGARARSCEHLFQAAPVLGPRVPDRFQVSHPRELDQPLLPESGLERDALRFAGMGIGGAICEIQRRPRDARDARRDGRRAAGLGPARPVQESDAERR